MKNFKFSNTPFIFYKEWFSKHILTPFLFYNNVFIEILMNYLVYLKFIFFRHVVGNLI